MPKKSKWFSPGNHLLSLPENGSLKLLWNWTYVCSMFCLSLMVCIIAVHSNTHMCGLFLAFEIVTLILSVSLIVKRSNKLGMAGFLILMTAKNAFFICCSAWYLFYIYIDLTQSIFTLTYFFLRYYFDPDFDFVKMVKKMIKKSFKLIIGKETSDFIRYNEK